MHIRQSMIKTWAKCPLMFKFQEIDGLPREQSGSLTYGSILHVCVEYLETTGDLEGAIKMFQHYWQFPAALDPTYTPQYYVRGTSWKKFWESGPGVLRDWWKIISWDSDTVLAREHSFSVPIGDGHHLDGTADKVVIRYMAKINRYVLLISDYKSNKKNPTYDYLAEDLQFSAYCYASTQREFWTGIPNGDALFQQYADAPRYGEWVQLTGPKRMDAGVREQRHYNRVAMAVNGIAESIAMGIFIPNISGESCRYCPFRKPCGLPEIEENE